MRRNVACLIEAINEGRSSRVVKNLQAGVDPNGEEDGVTPIAAGDQSEKSCHCFGITEIPHQFEKKRVRKRQRFILRAGSFPAGGRTAVAGGREPERDKRTRRFAFDRCRYERHDVELPVGADAVEAWG